MKNKIVCNKCQKVIKMPPSKIVQDNIVVGNESLFVKYFKCGNCKEIYIIAIINEEAQNCIDRYEKIQRELKFISANAHTLYDYAVKYNALVGQINIITKEYTSLQSRLKTKYEKVIKQNL